MKGEVVSEVRCTSRWYKSGLSHQHSTSESEISDTNSLGSLRSGTVALLLLSFKQCSSRRIRSIEVEPRPTHVISLEIRGVTQQCFGLSCPLQAGDDSQLHSSLQKPSRLRPVGCCGTWPRREPELDLQVQSDVLRNRLPPEFTSWL